MRKKLLRTVAVLCAAALLLAAVPFSAFADEAPLQPSEQGTLLTSTDSPYPEYKQYISEHASIAVSSSDDAVVLSGAQGVAEEGQAQALADYTIEGTDISKKDVLDWSTGEGSVTYTFTVPKTALYNFSLTFLPPENGVNVELGLLLDGEHPFSETTSLKFTRDWVNVSDEFREDDKGNQIAPEQKLTGDFVSRLAEDNTGVNLEPFMFYLTEGEHTVTLVGYNHHIVIASLGFTAPEKAVSYEDYFDESKYKEDTSVKPITIEGEAATVKNENSLVPRSTNGNINMSPVDPYLTLVNNIGGTTWGAPGQEITWEFEVETAGYYKFGAHYKQNEVINGESWRWMKIDGKTPFEEAKGVRFAYDTQWKYYEFGDGEKEYYIWLDKGTHTMSMSVTLGALADYYDRLNKITTSLGDMYLQIVMIASENPDVNRDYELFRQIPTFEQVLSDASVELRALVKDMQNLTGERGSQYIAAMNNMDRVINQMLDAPYIAHIYVSDYYSNYTTLSSWLSEMKKMPVSIDRMQFVYAGQDFDWEEANFFEKLWFEILRLVSSFVNDYTLFDEGSEGAVLKMWVNWGRDQTMALNSLIKDSFTPNEAYYIDGKPVQVNLQIVSASLINGLLADNFPDVQLHLSRTDPVNYGMRGALLDLTQFPDYKEVLSNFQPGADMPYWHNGALYAIPDTQGFFCLFYRTDVFEQLGLTLPTTWEEYLYCATIIQRYNMGVYVPYTQITTSTTVNAGIGSLNIYPTLMMQNGLSLYNDELNATEMDSVKAIQVFEEWTEIYSDYGYLKEADFYNRFRNGSMPLGIAPYSTYMTIYSAAPEIDGRWAVANVPGTYDEEGNLNQTIAGSGSGAAIVKRSANKEAAWNFLKWWTSAETQTRYSNNVESVIGMLGRVGTSNVEAFNDLAWDPADLEALNEQWSKVVEVPEVPGSYYLTRAVDQAFWAVINDGSNAKDAINKWSMVADQEIKRKIEEYS